MPVPRHAAGGAGGGEPHLLSSVVGGESEGLGRGRREEGGGDTFHVMHQEVRIAEGEGDETRRERQGASTAVLRHAEGEETSTPHLVVDETHLDLLLLTQPSPRLTDQR